MQILLKATDSQAAKDIVDTIVCDGIYQAWVRYKNGQYYVVIQTMEEE